MGLLVALVLVGCAGVGEIGSRVGGLVRGQGVDPRNLTIKQQQQLKRAMESGKLSDWVAKKYRNGRADPDVVSAGAGC